MGTEVCIADWKGSRREKWESMTERWVSSLGLLGCSLERWGNKRVT